MRQRADVLLVQQGLCPSRERAKEAIQAGRVLADGVIIKKPGQMLEDTEALTLNGESLRYVSRGGLKLEKALDAFGVAPEGRVCLDCGASTGGFTDCLLQRGASRVYALDVGSAQLAEKLRQDPRVVSMEKTNARSLAADSLPEKPSLIVIDVSFISLRLVLPAALRLLADGGEIVALVKPQFEAGRERLGKNGVVKDPAVHRQVLEELLEYTPALGLFVWDLTWSPIRGPEGNIEYLCHLRRERPAIIPDAAAVAAASHRETL